jgi:hypothetical protein
MLISAMGSGTIHFFPSPAFGWASFVYFELFVVILTAPFKIICSYLEVLAVYEPLFLSGCDRNVIDLWAQFQDSERSAIRVFGATKEVASS